LVGLVELVLLRVVLVALVQLLLHPQRPPVAAVGVARLDLMVTAVLAELGFQAQALVLAAAAAAATAEELLAAMVQIQLVARAVITQAVLAGAHLMWLAHLAAAAAAAVTAQQENKAVTALMCLTLLGVAVEQGAVLIALLLEHRQ
jgi:hypothetical protein